MKFDVIIAAAGNSERAGGNKLKFDLGGMPLLHRTVAAFSDVERVESIILCVKAGDEDFAAEALRCAGDKKSQIVLGGSTRSETVLNGLKAASAAGVLIHDGARPYPDSELINSVMDSVESYRSGVPVLQLSDSVRTISDGRLIGEFPRESLVAVQTPQGYLSEELLSAYAATSGKEFADESARYAAVFPEGAHAVPGNARNLKITSHGDFASLQSKIGVGYDIHRLMPFGKLMIVLAHSDGDVALHALIDALLSAAGESDIGTHFPDNDPRYDGIDSSILLTKTMEILQKKNLRPTSVSIIIRLQSPKIGDYIPVMKVKLSSVLGIPMENIGISAKTGEGMDSVGKGLAIAAEAAVLLV